MIIFNDINLSWGNKTLFAGLNWSIPPGSRIGLIGNNGTGKTTLLKIILGDAEPDRGSVVIPEKKKTSVGYLPQDMIQIGQESLMDFLKQASGIAEVEQRVATAANLIASPAGNDPAVCQALKDYDREMAIFDARDGYTFEARAKQVLAGLGFNEKDSAKNCREFSGGWQMRIYLALLLLSRPDILLLDEPTNHLDTPSLEWLEDYLTGYPGTIIAVSHDRFFLDKTVNQIALLEGGKLMVFHGNYSAFLEEKERRQALAIRETINREAEIARHHAFIERFRYKATKARQVQSRIKMLEKIPVLEEAKSANRVVINLPEPVKAAHKVIEATRLSKNYGALNLFQGLNVTIFRGEKVALVGANGSGKSTLTRLLARQEEPTEGAVEWGNNVRLSLFSQDSSANLNYGQTVWGEIMATPSPKNDQEKRNLLGAFLFSGEEILKPISVLSGGEKSRLALLKVLLGATNLLILDEPTNHLDMDTREIFLKALTDYRGTVVLVSHDRYFLDRLVGRVLEIDQGKLHDYHGNYSYFVEKKKERLAMIQPPAHSVGTAASGKTGKPASDKRHQAEERNRLYRSRSAFKKELAILEEDIFKLEEEKSKNESLLCDPATLKDSAKVRLIHRDLKDITQELAGLYERWDELGSRMAGISSPGHSSGDPPK